MTIVIETDHNRKTSQDDRELKIGGFRPHESIYKYVSLGSKTSWNYFEKTFLESALIGSPANALNDPFEVSPIYFNDLTKEKIKNCCQYYDNSGSLKNGFSEDDHGDVEKFSARVNSSLKNLVDKTRILSFCRRSDSPLLWSHYANSHKGACIHFSSSAFIGMDLIKGQVEYTHNRPVIPMSLPAKIIAPKVTDHHPVERCALRTELFSSIFFKKPFDWSYEEEVRVIYSVSKMTNVKFDKSCLFEVIIGARCDEVDRERIKEIVRRSGVNVKIRQAAFSGYTFGVDIVEGT